MTLFTTDYLEYYLTLLGWIIHNGIWAVLVSSGVFALPFVAIIIQEWLKARAEGADEGNKGALSSVRIENRVWVAIVVVMFAGVPFIDVDLNTIQYDGALGAVPGQRGAADRNRLVTVVQHPHEPDGTVPVWWAFIAAPIARDHRRHGRRDPVRHGLAGGSAWKSMPRASITRCWHRK